MLDHGPWNSWDRVPYITTLRTGKASIIPADRHIHHNFVLGTYNVQAAIDTDDGSSYYQTYDNFLAYAGNGMKSDYGGHDHVWTGNIIAYAGTCFDFGMTTRPFARIFLVHFTGFIFNFDKTEPGLHHEEN
jgi:hypothetical protein